MEKKEKEGEDLGKGMAVGWRTPPLLFAEITDYLTQINNLPVSPSPSHTRKKLKEKEEEEASEGLRFEAV